jgi:Fe-S oxidoreductase
LKLKTTEDARQACAFCPKLCRHACPTSEAERTELATPTFKQQVALLAARGERPLDRDRARVLFKCTDCHATTDACRHRIAVSDSLREARAQAVTEGVAPREIDWLRERFEQHGSPYSAKATTNGLTRATSGDAILPSCTALAHDPAEVEATAVVLGRLGEPTAVALPDPLCCGYPLDTAGELAAFKRQAERVASSLEGFSRLIALGPACAYTLTTRYREIGVTLAPAITPLVDVLAEHADALRNLSSSDPGDERYAYHDPCFLARRLGRTEEPRAALRSALGSEPVELAENRSGTRCSGGGGTYPLTHPRPARACADRVLDLYRESHAHVLVTACASARRRFLEADPSLDVRSLASVIEERTRQ